jgi:hypothetical protein
MPRKKRPQTSGTYNYDLFETYELVRWLRLLKAQKLSTIDQEQFTARVIGEIEDELAGRRANRLDAIHVQGQRK